MISAEDRALKSEEQFTRRFNDLINTIDEDMTNASANGMRDIFVYHVREWPAGLEDAISDYLRELNYTVTQNNTDIMHIEW